MFETEPNVYNWAQPQMKKGIFEVVAFCGNNLYPK